MKIRSGAKAKEQPNEGTHLARVVGLCNLGLQPGFMYGGEMTEDAYKIEITYELVATDMKDGRPFHVSEDVTNTDNEKGKLLQRCMSTGVSINAVQAMITKPCMVSLKHNEKGYAKINNVAGVPAGIPVPELRNTPVYFDIYADEADVETFNSFSDFKKSKFTKALDYKETALYKAVAEGSTSDDQF